MSARRSSICFCWPLKPRSSLLIRPLTSLFISSDGLPGKSLTSPGAIPKELRWTQYTRTILPDGILISAYIELELSSNLRELLFTIGYFEKMAFPSGADMTTYLYFQSLKSTILSAYSCSKLSASGFFCLFLLSLIPQLICSLFPAGCIFITFAAKMLCTLR